MSHVQVNLSRLVQEDRVDVTPSAKLKSVKIDKVIVTFPEGAAEMQNKSSIERFVRKALLRQGVELVVGEVRAKVETDANLQGRKESLSEAEKLIVLGRDTGADAILVFDEITMTRAVGDVSLEWSDPAQRFELQTKPATPTEPRCPEGFRVYVPSFIAVGRLISAADATILAEFDVAQRFFINPGSLTQTVQVEHYVPTKRMATGTLGQGPTVETYEYVEAWDPVDVSCERVRDVVFAEIPPQGDEWRYVEANVASAIESIVDGTLRPDGAAPASAPSAAGPGGIQ